MAGPIICGGLASGPHQIPYPPSLPQPHAWATTQQCSHLSNQRAAAVVGCISAASLDITVFTRKMLAARNARQGGRRAAPLHISMAALQELDQNGTRTAHKGTASHKTQGFLKNARLAPKKVERQNVGEHRREGPLAARAWGNPPSRSVPQGRHPTFQAL